MTDTPEDVKARVAAGFDRAAATYDTVIPFFETFARFLVDEAALRPGERALDVACGRGACLPALAHEVESSGYVLGVDLSSVMTDLARLELDRRGLQPGSVDVRVGDAEHLDVPDESFDVVVCGFGVFFFPDPSAALAESWRVLRPGGRFVASTFVGGGGGYPWIGDILREILPASSLWPRSPVATATGLTEHLVHAGFVEPTTREVEARFVFPDVDAYLAWTWSHGTRRVLESLSDQQADLHRIASAKRLEKHAVPGGYELVQGVELTTARRPSQ